MNILAINDARTDAGIAYYKNNKLKFAISEERITRVKTKGGFPRKSLKYFATEYAKELDSISCIVFAGILTPAPITRLFTKIVDYDEANRKYDKKGIFDLMKWFIEYKLRLTTKTRPNSKLANLISKIIKNSLKKKLPEKIRNKPIYFVEHHICHANTAFFSSGFDESLVASFDGFGDSYSAKIYVANEKKMKCVYKINALDSFALFYAQITEFFGFKPDKHEGKVTGLAAFGNETNVKEEFPFIIGDNFKVRYTGKHGMIGLNYLKKKFYKYKREDVAAWLQNNTERFVCKIISHFMKETNQNNICLVGGLFGNVKLNQRVHELTEVKKIYIYPAMGDMGIAHGAALTISKEHEKINSVFYGPKYSDKEIENALIEYKLVCKRENNIEKKIAKLLANGKIVARFNGRMEYGPRALGNRSILVQATDKNINDFLNKKLKRTEFMPFAPTILDKFAPQCIEQLSGAELTSKFMNLSFNVTDYMKETCPAAVHIDNTARPQILFKEDNESFHKILEEYYKLTNIPAIINTSFNIHEEPIVMTPEDAIRGFLEAKLDYLAIGNFIVKFDQNVN